MQLANVSERITSASSVRSSSEGMQGRAPRSFEERDSIVEAERRGNLVIAGLAFCLLSGVVALAVS